MTWWQWLLNECKFLWNKNILTPALAGFFFFYGWWIFIDLSVNTDSVTFAYAMPAIVLTIAGIIINSIPVEMFFSNAIFSDGVFGNHSVFAARLILFFGLMASFGSLIAATYILIQDFILNQNREQYPGYAILMTALYIFISSMLLRFVAR